MQQILEHFNHYIANLDWAFIVTFIIMGYGLNSLPARISLFSITKLTMPTRYRILIVGVLFGVLIYFVRGYTLGEVETLFHSFVFAIVFHKMLVDNLILMLSNLRKRYFQPSLYKDDILRPDLPPDVPGLI